MFIIVILGLWGDGPAIKMDRVTEKACFEIKRQIEEDQKSSRPFRVYCVRNEQ